MQPYMQRGSWCNLPSVQQGLLQPSRSQVPRSYVRDAGGPPDPASPSLASPFSGHVGVKQPAVEASSIVTYCGATLVVCPLVAVIQWRQEIARFTAAGSVKVSLHGLLSAHACSQQTVRSRNHVRESCSWPVLTNSLANFICLVLSET